MEVAGASPWAGRGRAVGMLSSSSNSPSRVWLTPGTAFCLGQHNASDEGHRDRTYPMSVGAGVFVYSI